MAKVSISKTPTTLSRFVSTSSSVVMNPPADSLRLSQDAPDFSSYDCMGTTSSPRRADFSLAASIVAFKNACLRSASVRESAVTPN